MTIILDQVNKMISTYANQILLRQPFVKKACILALIIYATSTGFCGTIPANNEDAHALLLGNWYGEMACNRCGDRDYLRWTRLNQGHGEQRVHFRYYRDGKVRQNVIRLGHWGYRSGIYWLTCESYIVDGHPQSCPQAYYEFVVESLDGLSMTYHNDKLGVRYTAHRVADDFELKD